MRDRKHRQAYGRPVTVLALVALLIMGVAGGVLASDQFDDVPTDHTFHDEIGWMADTGISNGFNGGTEFRPGAAVTRQAMAAFMQRLAGQDPDVDPMVTAADSEQLGGDGPDHFVDRPGNTRIAVQGGNFVANNPSKTVNDWNQSRVSDWNLGSGNNFLYAWPDVETDRFGETLYLHRARFCVDASAASVTEATLEVHENATDGTQPLRHETIRSSEFGEDGCFNLNVDTCPTVVTSYCGFELGFNDAVALRLQIDSPAADTSFSTKAAFVDTSTSSSRQRIITFDDASTEGRPSIEKSDDVS